MEQSIQVTPITEGEIMTLRNLFAKFADTITDASHMRGEIEEVRQSLSSLRQDNEYLRAHNREMDEALAEARRQRDNAFAELEAVKRNVTGDEDVINNLRRNNDQYLRDLSQAQADIVTAKRNADDMAYANMELSDKLKLAREWIEQVRMLFNNPPML